MQPVEYDPFAGGEILRTVPSTPPQREVWLADRMSREASLAYNESVSLRLRGPLRVDALQSAVSALAERHESLRSTFSADGLTLVINAATPIDLPLVDLAALSAGERERRVAETLRRHVEQPFELEKGPLFRAELLRLGAEDHLLILTAHHIVCDGWSFWVLVKDVAALYGRATGARAEKLPPPESFGDYAVALAEAEGSAERRKNERYWLQQLSGELPSLDLPTDRARPGLRTYASGREDYLLDAALVAEAKKLGARHGASVFATLLGGFAGLLHRLTGQGDLIIGIPAAGQAVGGHAELVGHCVNMLPLRLRPDADRPFSDLLASARSVMLDAYDHQECTFGELLRKLPLPRDPGRPPLVSVIFNIDQALSGEAHAFPGLSLEFASNPRRFETFELFVNAADTPEGLRLECQYNSGLFDGETIRRWMRSYEVLLRGAVAAAQTPLGALPLLSAEDEAALRAFNRTEAEYPRGTGVHRLFAEQAARAPGRPAVRFAGQSTSYGDLAARAGAIARALRARGVRRGDMVGLLLERSPDLVAAAMGVLQAGGAYVPLDPAYPAERLAFMVRDSGMNALVTAGGLDTELGLRVEGVLRLDAHAAELAAPGEPAPEETDPRDPAYVIYTSGSTGKPKGVRVPHGAVVNLITSLRKDPGFTADDRVVALTTLSFDIAVVEILMPLTLGAEIILASRAEATDGQALRALAEGASATIVQATPATWRMLVAAGYRGGPNVKAFCGGEPLARDLAEGILARVGGLWNLYGPTETTVYSTGWKVENLARGIFIGRPVANTQVWIMDERRNLCPIGVPGEIYIAGDGVALDYLGRPELTAERFVPDPFRPGARMYRTGDLGRWHPDGLIEYLGRTDFQVKVRGYRIELGEIEAALVRHPGVAQAVAMAREDRPGDVRLVAYLVARGVAPTDGDLRAHLERGLPSYMVPAHFVALPSLPLLPNGKVNRKALPAPAAQARAADAEAAPRTATEKAVARLFEEALAIPRVGLHDNFFLMGGHSLLAAQVTAKLGQELGTAVPMRALFEAPTIERLAAWIEGRGAAKDAAAPPRIPRRADQARAPLSLMQQRLWFLDQLDPGDIVYNVPSAHRLTGPLDERAFERAFNEMIRRQSSLRTVLADEAGEGVQLVLPELTVSLFPAEDLSGVPAAEREATLMRRIAEEIPKPFDLQEGPLFRAKVFRLGPEEHALFFQTHHVIWDGWSFDLLYEEMSALYPAFCEGRPSPLPELPVSYGDFAAWHREWMQGEELAKQVAFWKQRLAGKLEPLELPTDRPRPAVATGGGSTEWLRVPKAEVEALRALGQKADATLFVTLLAAYYVLLHRMSGQRDLIVGTPVRGRSLPEVEKVMGFFVNALPLRVQIDPDKSFLEFLGAVRRAVFDGFGYQDVPFEHLVRELDVVRDESRFPIYQAFFSFQDVRARPTRWGNLKHGFIEAFPPSAAQDVGLWFMEGHYGLLGGLNYNTDIFTAETARLMNSRFAGLLAAVVKDPERPVRELDVVAREERERLEVWNTTPLEYPRESCVHELVFAQAARAPEAIAVHFGGWTTSYGELGAKAHRIARALRKRGVRRGDLVGVLMERSTEMLATVLGVLEAGGAYVPLDPGYPPDRLAFMVGDSRMRALVTRGGLDAELGLRVERVLRLDADAAELAAESADPLPRDDDRAAPADPAYVIYTSGSTGKPKGVRVPHRAVVNFLESMRREPGLVEADRLVAVTTLSFDIAVLELFLPLTVGAQIVLASRAEATDGRALRTLIETSGATVMQATPATWRLLLEAGWEGGPSFKALCGGEPLPVDLAEALLPRLGSLWNMYGPTETTVWSTCWRVENPQAGIPIGKPIANTQVWILDEHRNVCPIGVPGEIYIGGDGVTLGYLERPELTAERFVADPFRPGGRLYRTGDLGRWRADGLLECLGRTDFQVKVRGYRIELGEIEANLAGHPAVAQAVVAARAGAGGEKQLVGYVIAREGQRPEATELRKHLRATLPDYMVPSAFVTMTAFPLTPNGKVDRRALPDPAPVQVAESAPVALRTPTEKMVAEVWQALLNLRSVGPQDNFFDLGGHSLLVMRAIAEMEKRTGGKRINPRSYIFQTLEQVAHSYDQTQPPPPKEPGGLMRRLLSTIVKS